MCQQCVDLVKIFYPNLPEEDYSDLLMSATAFPFGTPTTIYTQLAELRMNTDGTLLGAIEYASEQMRQAKAA